MGGKGRGKHPPAGWRGAPPQPPTQRFPPCWKQQASKHASRPALQVLRKLEASLAAGQFYEAHEMFKTVYYRHRSRSQSEESYQLCQVGGGATGSAVCPGG